MLSWNKQAQKQNKNINKAIYKQVNSENKLGFHEDCNEKIRSKGKIEKEVEKNNNNKNRL